MSQSKRAPNRRRLTDQYIRKLTPPSDKSVMVWDTAQGGLALRVRPTGTKTFKCCYRHQGRLRWYTIDRYPAIGLSEAREVARNIRAQATLGADPQGEKMQSRVGDSLAHIHADYVTRYAQANNKSWKQANTLMRSYVLPKLGNRKARDINRRDVRRIFDELTEGGRKVLANQVLAAMSAVFSWAVEREIVEANPCHGIKRNKLEPSRRFLSNDEIRVVWLQFEALGLLPMTALKIILYTAQRPGEVCAMRWEHLDLDAGLWTMPGEPSIGWPGTKNGRTHEVPLTAPILDLLRGPDFEPTEQGHVFPSTKRGKSISIPRVMDVWKAAGIKRFRPHDLRATAATGMDRLGIVRQHISLVLNHSEAGVTASYVRHDHRQHKRNALDVWATELMAILAGAGTTDQTAEVIELAKAAE